MAKNRIGIDVGGTNVKIALVDDKGNILYSNSVPTRAEMGYEYTVTNIKQAIYELMKETKLSTKDIEGIGFGFPGQVDYKSGIVRLAPNIPGWVEVPIAKLIEDEFHIPTRVDNDVRCAALGELNYGAGKGCENLICITVGTGIGSGLIVNGRLVRGASNAAGEIGHIKLQSLQWQKITSKAENQPSSAKWLTVTRLHLTLYAKLQKQAILLRKEFST